jgi:Bacteriophage Lambda NinG protein
MNLRTKPPKTKICKVCRTEFVPQRIGAKVCSPPCAMTFARAVNDKAAKVSAANERRADKTKLEALKTRGQWVAIAQAAFNAYVRARDAGKPCICCGRMSAGQTHGGDWDAGHYRSRGSAPHLRFDERNVHAQLKQCNRYQSGNVVGYRAGLIQRIGLDALEALEADQTPRKHTITELQAIKAEYTAKTKALKASSIP